MKIIVSRGSLIAKDLEGPEEVVGKKIFFTGELFNEGFMLTKYSASCEDGQKISKESVDKMIPQLVEATKQQKQIELMVW